jgi:hypothetical protein
MSCSRLGDGLPVLLRLDRPDPHGPAQDDKLRDFSLITTDVLLYPVIKIELMARFLRSQIRIP